MMKNFVLVTVILLASFTTMAALKLPEIFAGNMILQREMPLKIWGKSVAGERVSVKLNIKIKRVVTDKNGDWQVTFEAMKAGGPYLLKVSTDKGETILLKNILMGDVWICAGQSNINFMLAAEKNEPEVLKNLNNTNIREYRCAMPAGVENPENNSHLIWVAAVAEKAASFWAVVFYFAKQLQESEQVPVGLIWMACGNKRAESWIDTGALQACTSSQPLLHHWQKRKAKNDIVIDHAPGIFYEAVVKPVMSFAVKGVLWYQGESNTLPDNSGRNINERTGKYKPLLKAFINE
jgi:sialate O-acetylesterase